MSQTSEIEVYPVTAMPAVATDQGVTVTTHDGRAIWTIRPRNPRLLSGHALPDTLYGDIIGVVVDGRQRPNNRTYAMLEKIGQLTVSAQSLDPQR
jgi:hypothetical protein